jgi:predicted dehydrogenase
MPPSHETSSAPVRVALIGYGLAGSAFHAPLIVATPALRLDAIVTRDPTRRAQAAHDHPRARVVDTADELWENARNFDLAVVATPNSTHAPLARAALEAGLAVVVDKPFAPTVEEAGALIEEAHRRQLILTVFHNRRWDGDFLTVRRLLAEHALGQIFRFESRFDRWRPTPKPGWRERSDPHEAGGLLYDLGSHLIDQALLLFGPVATVYAELDRRREGVEVDDDAFVALTHVSGVRSHLGMTTVAAQSGARFRVLGSRAAYVKYGPDVQEEALRRGERADSAGWGEEPRERWGTLGAGDDVRVVPTETGNYPAFYAAVAAAIRGRGHAPVDPNDAVNGLQIIAAAQRSFTERRVVPLT